MKKLKEIYTNVSNKIKKSNLVRLINFKATIKGLNDKIGDLEEEKKQLSDIKKKLESELKKITKIANKVPSMEDVIKGADKSLKEKVKENKNLNDLIADLKSDLFNKELELETANAQLEEYKLQIKDLKSNRYLIRKIPSGKTPNTNKTKVSRPMSSNVTRYMRGEHE